MRAKIWQLIKEHNYRPNSVARSLVKRRSRPSALVPRGPLFRKPLLPTSSWAQLKLKPKRIRRPGLQAAERKGARVLRKSRRAAGSWFAEDDASIPLIKEELTTVFVNRQIKMQPAL